MMNRDHIARSISVIRHFIDDSFGLSLETHTFTGFELSEPLLDAAAYIERTIQEIDQLMLPDQTKGKIL